MTRAVVSREAYGVRGACSRCRMCGAVRKREQAPRTPYASRGLVPVMPAWGQTRPTRQSRPVAHFRSRMTEAEMSLAARTGWWHTKHSVNCGTQFQEMLSGANPILALAPMQDVTDLPFLKLMAAYGGADLYFTEYFRVHSTSTLDKHILRSITENPTGRPIIAQMIGNDIPSLVRTVRELEQYPVAAVDLNLGCPAPVVYRKCAGGGLLREPQRVDSILGALREAVTIPFTVKTRIGFDSPEVFSELLPIFVKHSLDLLTVHGRTVKEMYRPEVHYEYIARAVAEVPCPVLANGNVHSPQSALEILN